MWSLETCPALSRSVWDYSFAINHDIDVFKMLEQVTKHVQVVVLEASVQVLVELKGHALFRMLRVVEIECLMHAAFQYLHDRVMRAYLCSGALRRSLRMGLIDAIQYG